ncbi:Protein kinase domain [Dillenia turbinata]|uniref:Protein kinase domain n=1 Tax=Dillenia turbinata TaxID=194707 RepID=A0AAN8YW94_9MAGN
MKRRKSAYLWGHPILSTHKIHIEIENEQDKADMYMHAASACGSHPKNGLSVIKKGRKNFAVREKEGIPENWTQTRPYLMKIYNLLLKYCSGGAPNDMIQQSGGRGLPESDVRHYTNSILKGVSDIHDTGYVHCDLKPANIFLVPISDHDVKYVVKIGDFGLAKKYCYQDSKKKTIDPEMRGTSMYLSPEVVADNVQGPPSDIWAVVCIVLQMKVPFPDETSEEAKDFLKRCLVRNHMFSPLCVDDECSMSFFLDDECMVYEWDQACLILLGYQLIAEARCQLPYEIEHARLQYVEYAVISVVLCRRLNLQGTPASLHSDFCIMFSMVDFQAVLAKRHSCSTVAAERQRKTSKEQSVKLWVRGTEGGRSKPSIHRDLRYDIQNSGAYLVDFISFLLCNACLPCLENCRMEGEKNHTSCSSVLRSFPGLVLSI